MKITLKKETAEELGYKNLHDIRKFFELGKFSGISFFGVETHLVAKYIRNEEKRIYMYYVLRF